MTFTISGVDNLDNLKVGFTDNVKDADDNPVPFFGNLCFGVVAGDANQDRAVWDQDHAACYPKNGENVDSTNFTCDLDKDGTVEWAQAGSGDDWSIYNTHRQQIGPAPCATPCP